MHLSKSSKQRLNLTLIIVMAIFILLVVRLIKIQIVDGEKYSDMAVIQQTKDIPIPAQRGEILDRNLKKLAINMTLYNIWGDTNRIVSPETYSKLIADVLDLDSEAVLDKISSSVGLISIGKWVDKDKIEEIDSLNLEGVWFTEVERRYYPLDALGAFVIGHTTADNRGLAGVELELNRYLTGLSGRWIRNTDVLGRQLPFGTDKYYEAQDGLNVILTIDEVLQYYMEQVIEKGREELGAKKIMALMMDPKTGDILAMASYPDYNPNDPRVPVDQSQLDEYVNLEENEKQTYWNQLWRNPIVSDTYEPGSTFKLITSAMALEENIARPDTKFYATGSINVAGTIIKCWRYYRPHGEQTLTQGLENSCNPVFVELGLKLGKDKFYKYLEAFGFMEKTGIELPGESSGLTLPIEKVGPVELATMSFGQGLSITPIQLITAVSAIANDGRLMEPRLISGLADNSGHVVESFEPVFKRQVISQSTSMEMLLMMESVVFNGSGKEAYIPGYRVGGKTGTAQKIVNGVYDDDKVIASFIGVAPVDDPKIAILLVIDEPEKSHFGSLTATPLAKEIIEKSLIHMSVEPRYTEDELEIIKKESVIVPDVNGMAAKDAIDKINKAGLRYSVVPEIETLDETHTVLEQYPYAGYEAQKGYNVIIYVE
ncbi:MAG: PASTA domain-containing protein [Peptostreptococcaceae bacterium]|nr:PASTA domain-containing protein [Peptostreptococcaceae bacterium]